ncbi:Non-histone chromosomal protein 6 [Zancudomyces culisetae]|uniref:Non-histone chromosomal protein 6 n=1 Tax=Zancudomyces culisetae TaxID=1213189 RepID=A0A1R1PG91_ZANCU|nr:Non-histone chromosomal protein 6 [Zancudomyces culisetae]|eukprot:OMH79994.1 Non-histone chromosomal protein 6 [Zancudomyces culisetae]
MPKAKKATTPPVKATKASKKDKTGPKRSLSAYMFFSQENREKVKRDNPSATFGELGKLLGEMWKGLSDTQKKPYNDKAAADKQRYELQKAQLKPKK